MKDSIVIAVAGFGFIAHLVVTAAPFIIVGWFLHYLING